MDILMSMGPMKDIRKNHTVVMSQTVTRLMFMKVKITKALTKKRKRAGRQGTQV